MGDKALSKPARPRNMRRAGTKRNMDKFFAALAETANVTQAAARVGIPTSTVYLRRQTDPAFAARWAAALEEGYARLEMLLLDQSVNGYERVETVTDADGAVKQMRRVRSFPLGVGLRLLQSHGETVMRYRAMAAGRDGPADDAMAARIRAELERVRGRLTAASDDSHDPKAGGGDADG